MQAINQKAAKVLTGLVKGLEVGDARKVDNTDGAYMPVHVDCIGDGLFAVAHYFYQNGDAMADPDVVFWRRDGRYYPVEVTMAATGYYDRVAFVEGGQVTKYKPRAYRDLKVFCGTWLQNIKNQQGL